MKTELAFLQSLSEAELRELVIAPLLQAMGYTEIRHTHGVLEEGKDIVFSQNDPLHGKYNCAAVVKSTKLSGSVAKNRSVRELYYQLSQALKSPYCDPFDGREVFLDRAYAFTPYSLSPQCIQSIASELKDLHNRIKFIDGPLLLKFINRHCPDLLDALPDPRKRYLQSLYHRFIDHPTLSCVARHDTNRSLNSIYTGGLLTQTTIEHARYITFAIPGKSEGQEQLSTAHRLHKYIVVLADVGAGKTTLLQKFLIDIAEGNIELKAQDDEIVPLFVPLSRLSFEEVTDVETFVLEVERYVTETDGFDDLDKYRDKCVLMLDGHDEVDAPDIPLNAILQHLWQHYKSVIITSRPSKMPLLLSKYIYYRLNPFSKDDIEQFLNKWFPDDPDLQQKLLRKIDASDELKMFCRTPLILTLYVILSTRYSTDDLPDRKTEIYRLIVDMLLGEWDSMRSVRNIFDSDMKHYALELLAGKMQFSGKRSFQRGELLEAIGEVLNSRMPGASREAMFNEIAFRSSLVRQAGQRGTYEFVHLSFQEYLAAQYLVHVQKTNKLGGLLFQDWWRNTLIFYFGSVKNMNSIDLPSDVPSGKELRLLEYLREAEFTSVKRKRKIYSIVLATVLESDLKEDDCIIISGLGNDALDRLNSIVDQSDGWDQRVSPRVKENYARILSFMDTEKAHDTIFERPFVWQYMKPENVIVLLPEIKKRVNTDVGRRFCVEFLPSIMKWIELSEDFRTREGIPIKQSRGFRELKGRILELYNEHEGRKKKGKHHPTGRNPYTRLKYIIEGKLQ